MIIKYWFVAALMLTICVLSAARVEDKEIERIQKATTVFQDFSNLEETIPPKIIENAEGIVIIPKMINAGFGIGGKRGKGVALVKLSNGEWSNPVFVTITGGSIGFQAGVQAVDLVLLFKHKHVLTEAKKGDFTIGGDLSAAAGPVGRSASAQTDYKLDAEVYSYSRSKGLFAGISLNGSNIAFDMTANGRFYGSKKSTKELFESAEHDSKDIKALKNALIIK